MLSFNNPIPSFRSSPLQVLQGTNTVSSGFTSNTVLYTWPALYLNNSIHFFFTFTTSSHSGGELLIGEHQSLLGYKRKHKVFTLNK